MQNLNLLILSFFLIGFSFGASSQIHKTNNKEQFDAFSLKLDSLRKEKNIPGLAGILIKDQNVIWSEGYGASHFDTGDGNVYKKVTPDTPFWIASVTKTFLGLLFLQLENEGKIDLDEKINDMPNWDNFCNWLANSRIIFGKNLHCNKTITIKNILNHTVNGEPGTQFFYNPIMYSRLSRYIEYKYGNSVDAVEQGHNKLAQLIQEYILSPSGMDNTMSSQWQEEKAETYFNMAQGYKYIDGGYTTLLPPERHIAGGAGIVSSVNDLAKYDIALDTQKLGDKKLMNKLFSPVKTTNQDILPYAFGWYVQDYKGKKLIWHAGWDEEAGFTALYIKVPEENLTFILLANSEGMWWGNPLDKAEVHKSLFAKLFLDSFLEKQTNQHRTF